MSSASELFHNRRSRIGRIDPDLGFPASSPIAVPNRRRSRHHHHRRGGEIEDSDPFRRFSSHSRHLFNREHESVRSDHGASQFSSASSSNSGTSSSRANRMQFIRTDQLPGDVLLARQRLVERLRGVSLSSNRQSSRLTSGVPWDEFAYNDDYRLVDAGDWDIETSADWLLGDSLSPPSSNQRDILSPLPNFSTKRPPGLNRAELKSLPREVFTPENKDALVLEVVRECSICLDRFHEGEELICLPCDHKFHSGCLFPWVRTCGDCPNCRASVVTGNQHGKIAGPPS